MDKISTGYITKKYRDNDRYHNPWRWTVPIDGETGRGNVRINVSCNVWKKRDGSPNVGGALLVPGVGTVLRLERDAWLVVK